MISKPEQIIKRIIKAVGKGQSVLIIGDWQEDLIKGIRENENTITQNTEPRAPSSELIDNSFTRIIADYNSPNLQPPTSKLFFNEARRLLLPTGLIIITANTNTWLLEKIFKFIKSNHYDEELNIKKIKPKLLQDLVHDHGFLIEAYNGYPNGHLLMIAEIQDKTVSTLFSSEKQETISNY